MVGCYEISMIYVDTSIALEMGEEWKMKKLDLPIYRILFWIMFSLLLIYLVGGELFLPSEWDPAQYRYEVFDVHWERVYADGTREPFSVPGTLAEKEGEVVILETTIPINYAPNSSIMFWKQCDNIKIYVDGTFRKEFDMKDSRVLGDSSPSCYQTFSLFPEDAGKKLAFVYTNNEARTYAFKQFYCGDKMGMWMSVIQQNVGAVIIAGLVIFLALICIFSSFVLEKQFQETVPVKWLGFGVLLTAIWILANSSMRQVLFPNVSVISDVAFIIVGILPVPFMLYVNLSQKCRYSWMYHISTCYVFLSFVVVNTIVVLGYRSYTEMFLISALGVLISIVLMIGTMVYDWVKKRILEYKTAAVSILIMCFGGIVQIIGYIFSWNVSYSGSVMALSLLMMMANALWGILKDMMKLSREKEEAVYATQAKAQFLASMSHEIRTPINAVLGMNEMILREEKDEQILGYSLDIQSAGQSLLALINDILDFSKIESGKMELVPVEYDVSSLLNDSYNLVSQRAKDKGLEVYVTHDANTPRRLFGDEVRIRQILVNLLTNGIKYTDSGSVTVFLGFKKLNEENIQLILKVKDTGIGITKEDCKKLFESFQRVDESRNRNVEGTGLGLSITKQLLELMNGTISVDSVYGKGSEFTVVIPQRVVSREPVGSLPKKAKIKNDKQSIVHTMGFRAPEARVLIVDDVKINLKVMEGLMKGTDIKIDSVLSGPACMEMMGKYQYDIIFLDHMMPDMDGVETLGKIQKMENNLNPDTPIIMLTANAIAGAREEYIEMGFSDYLSKPVQSEKLDEMLQKYLPKEKIDRVNNI